MPSERDKASDEYEHTQIGTVLRWAHGILAMIFTAIGIGMLIAGKGGIAIIPFVPAAFLVLCILFLDSLTVYVSRDEIGLSFGVGLIRKTISIEDLKSAAIVQNRSRRGGPIPGGMLYKVAGSQAVEIQLGNGRKIQIGTDEPEALLAAVESMTDTSV